MRVMIIGAIMLTMVSGQARASGKIYYGSRAGMTVTVTSLSGLGSESALIRAKHTRADAKAFCVEYAEDRSAKCVDKELHDTRLNDQIEANCRTGAFTTFYGERLRFVGPNKSKDDFAPKYEIRTQGGDALDGSGASGYSYDLDQFKALCPNRYIQDE